MAGFEYTKYIADNISKNDGIPLFKGKNVLNGEVVYEFESYIPRHISDELFRSQISKKCLLTPYVGTIGNIGIHNKEGIYHLGSNVGKIELFNGLCVNVYEEYVKFYLLSSYGYKELTKQKKATAQESISIEAIREVLIPLPPVAEQLRIVNEIDNKLSYIKEISKDCGKISELIGVAKSKILELAISGKLVPQDIDDEPAIELLKRINPNFKPCDNSHYENLPQGWAVCRLSDMVRIQNGFAFQSAKYIDVGIRIIRITNVQSGYIIDESPKFYPHNLMEGLDEYNLKNGDLLMSLTGNVGRVGIMPENLLPAALNQRVCCLKPKNNDIDKMYLFYYFQAEQFIQDCIASGKGVAQLNVSTEWLKHYIIQLPPKEEQSRIVKTIDALFSIIDKITAEL